MNTLKDYLEKTAVSAGWLREKIVSGLSKRNVIPNAQQQKDIASAAIGYARKGDHKTRKALRGLITNLKGTKSNTGSTSPNVNWENLNRNFTPEQVAVPLSGLGALTAGVGGLGLGLTNAGAGLDQATSNGEPSPVAETLLAGAYPATYGLTGAGVGAVMGANHSAKDIKSVLRNTAIGGILGGLAGGAGGVQNYNQYLANKSALRVPEMSQESEI